MKKLNIKKISIYLSFLLVSMLVFTACSKKDNADGPVKLENNILERSKP